MQTFQLNHKTAVITGGASGIGEAIAGTLAAHGARVHIVDLDGEKAENVARGIRQAGGQAAAHPCDVSDAGMVERVFDEISREGLHILVNSVGIPHVGRLDNTSPEDFDRVFRVNVATFYNSMRAAVAHMKESGGGVILNLSSIAASAGLADRFAYSMSKGAVRAMTFSVARDYLPHKIRCNCISPARVHTPFVDGFISRNYPGHEAEALQKLGQLQPIGRMGEPREVAHLALYLCSDEASFITGTDYPIDGGFFNLHG